MNTEPTVSHIILLPHLQINLHNNMPRDSLFKIRPSQFFPSENRRRAVQLRYCDFEWARCTEMNACEREALHARVLLRTYPSVSL